MTVPLALALLDDFGVCTGGVGEGGRVGWDGAVVFGCSAPGMWGCG